MGLALEGEYVKGHLTYCDLQEAPSKLQVPSLEPGKQVEDGQNRDPWRVSMDMGSVAQTSSEVTRGWTQAVQRCSTGLQAVQEGVTHVRP